MFFHSFASIAQKNLWASLRRFANSQSGTVTSEFVVVSALIISLAAGVLQMTSASTNVMAAKVGEEVLSKKAPSSVKHRQPAGGGNAVSSGGLPETAGSSGRPSSSGGQPAAGGQTPPAGDTAATEAGEGNQGASPTEAETGGTSDSAGENQEAPAKETQTAEKSEPSEPEKSNSSTSDETVQTDDKAGEQTYASNELDPSCYKKNGKIRKRCR